MQRGSLADLTAFIAVVDSLRARLKVIERYHQVVIQADYEDWGNQMAWTDTARARQKKNLAAA